MTQTLDFKENFFKEPHEVAEAWRCSGCSRLIYNVEHVARTNYPAPGAPLPKYVSADHPHVCNVCYAMYQAVDGSSYWTALAKRQRVVRADDWSDFS